VKILLSQKHETPSERQTKSKKTGDIAQVVEYMPSKCKALSLIPTTAQNKTKTLSVYHCVSLKATKSMTLGQNHASLSIYLILVI
jgi:hypothetical protein